MTNIVRTIIILTNFIKYNYEKMLVKVLHKETRQEMLISPRAYELAKKRYTFIGQVEDNDANTTTPKAVAATPAPQAQTAQTQTSEVDQSPNQKTTVREQAGDGGKVAEAVVSKPQQEKKKTGRKAKSISSPAPTVEV